MHDLTQTAEALPLVNDSHIYGGVGSNEVTLVGHGGGETQRAAPIRAKSMPAINITIVVIGLPISIEDRNERKR